jgi:hypothetical protein
MNLKKFVEGLPNEETCKIKVKKMHDKGGVECPK